MKEKLTSQEEEALKAAFKTGEGNIKMIMENMDAVLPYTTVASTIRNLDKKGFMHSRMVGNMYWYKPALSEDEFKRKFMNNVVRDYFDNSYKELVNFFVEQKKLSAKELKDILSMIEKGKQ